MPIPSLEDAIMLAANAHRGQVDKGGHPYILHPLRVMLRLDTDEARRVGVLHDVMEDCGVTVEALRAAGYPERELAALDALTRRAGESYESFILRLRPDPLARKVKLADLEDNSDLSRLRVVDAAAKGRLDRYQRARRVLLEQTSG